MAITPSPFTWPTQLGLFEDSPSEEKRDIELIAYNDIIELLMVPEPGAPII